MDVGAAIDAALRPLLGKPLWWDQRVIDLQVFGFGARLPGKGVNPEIPELSLHIQCRWRIVRGQSIAVGSADILWPPDDSGVSYDDFDYDGRRSRRDDLIDEFVLHGDEAHVVTEAVGRSTGDARITFLDGCVLELWPDRRSGVEADGPQEHWRFFSREQTAHFVVRDWGIGNEMSKRGDRWPVISLGSKCSLVLAAAAVGVGACELGFTDRGYSFVADNQSDVQVLAVVTRSVSSDETTDIQRQVLAVPPAGKVVLGQQPFAGNRVTRIEILTEECTSVAEFFDFTAGGAVVQVRDGPTATLVRDWPQAPGEPSARAVDSCVEPSASGSQ